MRQRNILTILLALVLLTLWLGSLTYYAMSSAESALAQQQQQQQNSGQHAAGQQSSEKQGGDSDEVKLLKLQIDMLKRRNEREAPQQGDEQQDSNHGDEKEGKKEAGSQFETANSEKEAALLRKISKLRSQLRAGQGKAVEIEEKLNATIIKLETCQRVAKERTRLDNMRGRRPDHGVEEPKTPPPEEDADEETPVPSRHHKRHPHKKHHRRKHHSSEDDDTDEETTPAPPPKRKLRTPAPTKKIPTNRNKVPILDRERVHHEHVPDPEDAQAEQQAWVDDSRDVYPTDAPEPPSVGIDEENIVDTGATIPIVIFSYNRPDILKKCIETVLKRMPKKGFHLYVSQDSRKFPAVTQLIERYASQGKLTHLIHRRDDSGANAFERQNNWQPYFAIAHHYQFAMEEIFKIEKYNRLILLEEDIEVGVDFFDYMLATSPLMDTDPSIYCVSAWNDNGKKQLISDATQLYRSDFFPGLGWMISRSVWDSIKDRWPKGFWDDWMRQPDKRDGRSCIRPEVPRTFTWCNDEGVSQGQFCAEHLEEIKLVDKKVDFQDADLDYLVKDTYDKWLDKILRKAHAASGPEDVARLKGTNQEVKILYRTKDHFRLLAQKFNIMDDFKDDVPRTAYRGIVTFRYMHHRVHLVSEEEMYE